MRSSFLKPERASVVLMVVALAFIGRAAADCCVPDYSWGGGGTKCTGRSTTICDEASLAASSGRQFDIITVPAKCHEFALGSGQSFVQADCNNPPAGYTRIGPPTNASKNICCFSPISTPTTDTDRGFNIVPCNALTCTNGGGGT